MVVGHVPKRDAPPARHPFEDGVAGIGCSRFDLVVDGLLAIVAWTSVSGARPPPGPRADHALAAAQAQGISSSMRAAGQRLTSFVSTSVVQASGSTPLSLHVSNSDAMVAQFSAPPLQALGRGRRTARSCG